MNSNVVLNVAYLGVLGSALGTNKMLVVPFCCLVKGVFFNNQMFELLYFIIFLAQSRGIAIQALFTGEATA